MNDGANNSKDPIFGILENALAASLTSVEVDLGVQYRKKPSKKGAESFEIEKVVENYKKIVADIKSKPSLQSFSGNLSENGYSPFLLQEILIALVTIGFNADLSSAMADNTYVRNAIEENLMTIDRAFLGLATLLESNQEEPAESIRSHIERNKEDLLNFQKRFSEIARQRGATDYRLNKFNDVFSQILWRTTKQSTSALTNRCVEVIDRVAGKLGIEPETRRDLCKKLSTITDFEQGDSIMREVLDKGIGNQLVGFSDDTDESGNDPDEKPEKSNVMTVGMMLLGIGGVSIMAGFASIQSVGLFIITGGVLALFLGMIFVILGLIVGTAKKIS